MKASALHARSLSSSQLQQVNLIACWILNGQSTAKRLIGEPLDDGDFSILKLSERGLSIIDIPPQLHAHSGLDLALLRKRIDRALPFGPLKLHKARELILNLKAQLLDIEW